MATILVTRPDFETTTHWGHYWVGETVEKLRKNHNVVDLEKQYATKSVFHFYIQEKNPELVIGVGHGRPTLFTGHNYSHLLEVGREETVSASNNRHFCLLSCLVGRRGGLLETMVKKYGAVGAHGYQESFYFVINKKQYPNSLAHPFFDSHEQCVLALANGATHFEAHKTCVETFNKWINDPSIPELCKRYLLWDRNAKVFYGDWDARITDKKKKDYTVEFYLVEEKGVAAELGRFLGLSKKEVTHWIGRAKEVSPGVYELSYTPKPGNYRFRVVVKAGDKTLAQATSQRFTVLSPTRIVIVHPKGGEKLMPPITFKVKIEEQGENKT